MISTYCRYVDITRENNERITHYCTKEALIDEHNQKPLLAFYKGSIDWCSLLGNKQVITQVHSYDIIYTHPRLRLGLV